MKKTIRISTLEKIWKRYLAETPCFISEFNEVMFPNVSEFILEEIEKEYGFRPSITRLTKSLKSIVFIA
jgi:hypothetical protein